MARDGVVFLVNPASANGSTGRRWAEIAHRAAAAGLEGEALISTRQGEIAELAERAVADGAAVIVVVGGDGTVYEAVNGLIRSGASAEVDVAIVPRGTGTDFVRTFGITGDLDRAFATAREGRVRAVDVGRARYVAWDGTPAESNFANFAGAGISGAIARRANATSKAAGGRVSFMWATIAVFAGWKATPVELTVDGERRAGPMFEVLATIGEYAAGGMRVTPGAAPDDGLLDVITIGDVTKIDFVLTFPKIYRGTHVRHPKIETLRGRTVRIESEEPLPIALDGEQPGTTPLEVDLLPGALRLRVPAR
ncbi:MAG TPA: diacylglycerol kinase family protein [Gaiellaceae bacterium]|nr:diacylglycerol kinase family protein [Gaiellaceae bacterium]